MPHFLPPQVLLAGAQQHTRVLSAFVSLTSTQTTVLPPHHSGLSSDVPSSENTAPPTWSPLFPILLCSLYIISL